MKKTPFRRLWLPVSAFKQRYGKGKCFAIHPMLSKMCYTLLELVQVLYPRQQCLLAEVGATMISAFQELFGRSHRDCCLQDLPKLAESAREAPDTWFTAQCQHRWLLIARAIQGHDRSRRSALNSDTELWSILARVTDSVGLMFEGTPATAAFFMCIASRFHSMHHQATYWLASQQVAICSALQQKSGLAQTVIMHVRQFAVVHDI